VGFPEQKALKGCHFLLLRNYESLDTEYLVKLDSLLAVNKPLFALHSMKEQLRFLWEQSDREKALAFLNEWSFDALMSGIHQLAKVAMRFIKHQEWILWQRELQFTSSRSLSRTGSAAGPFEGIINKIKTIKRQAYGFRDMAYFTPTLSSALSGGLINRMNPYFRSVIGPIFSGHPTGNLL